MEFIKWLLSCGWKGCHSARWQWKCLQVAGQCSRYLMLEMWKQLCTRVVFDDPLSSLMVDLWLYKATCFKYGMSQIPATLDAGAVLAPWTIVLAHLLWIQGLRNMHCLNFCSLSCSGASLPWAAGWLDIALGQEPNVAAEWPLKVLGEQMSGCDTSQAHNGCEFVGSLPCTVSGGCHFFFKTCVYALIK